MSTQISEKLSLLFVNVRKMKKKTWVGNGKVFCALLRGLSKTFDCLDHELLKTKLNTYSFNLPALRLIHDYFSNIKLVKKLKILIAIGWKMYLGIPQGSLLRTLLFIQYLYSWSILWHKWYSYRPLIWRVPQLHK